VSGTSGTSGTTGVSGTSGGNGTAGTSGLGYASGSSTQVAYFSGPTSLTSSANLYWDNTNARLGISTTTPSTKLEIGLSNASHTNEGISFNSPGGYGQGAIYHDYVTSGDILTNLKLVNIYSDSRIDLVQDSYNAGGSPGSIRFYTQPSANAGVGIERVRITSAGNVGIGTTSPSQRLDISGSINVRSAAPTILFDRNGGYTWRLVNGDGTTFPLSTFNIANNGSAAIATFLDSGNVGIGTTSPDAKLEIKSSTANNLGGLLLRATSTANYPALLYENSSNGGTLDLYNVASLTTRISSNGDSYFISGSVGIGTSTPATKLQVNGTFASNALWTDSGGVSYWGPYSTAYGGLTWDTGYARVFATAGNALYLGANNGTHVTINTSGNVGIGITSPNALLDVAGGINSRNTRVDATRKYPIGHYSSGDTVFEIDPTWTQAQLQDYFGSTSFTWATDNTAPGGYVIQVDGAVNVGNVSYSSGFPFIPIDTGSNDWYYMECWIKNEAGSVNTHYMGSIDYNESFTVLLGNPGTFTYNVMSNYNPGTTWTKVFGYWNGTGTSVGGSTMGNTNNWPTASKYFSPLALFNYDNTSGTRRCYISGWRLIKSSNSGNRVFNDSLTISGGSLGTTSGDRKILQTFTTTNANVDNLEISQIRIGNGSDWYTAGNRIQQKVDGYWMGYIQFNGGNNAGISIGTGLSNTSPTSVSERIRITDTGNIGIGTTDPSAAKLVIASNGSSIKLQTVSDATNYYATINSNYDYANAFNITANGAGGVQTLMAWGDTVGLTLQGGASRPLALQPSNGKVGIGTTSPSTSLEVFSVAPVGDRTLPHNILTITAEHDNFPYAGFGGGIVFKNRTYTAGMLTSARVRSVINYSGDTGLEFGSSLAFDITPTTSSALTEAVRIRYDGNVGVGTTNPSTGKLQINTGAASNNALTFQASSQTSITYGIGINASSNLAIYDNFSSATRLVLNGDGDIGIGTTSPTAKLQVIGNARIGQNSNNSTNAVLDLTAGGSGYNSYIDFGYYGTFDAAIWFAGYFGDSSGQFKIRDASSGTATDALTISQGSRNVTINSLSGTGDRIVGTNSGGTLSAITVGSGLSLSSGTLTATGGSAGTVTGTGASTQVAYWTSTSNITGSNGFIYDNTNGRVGIGTTSPGFTLDAQGGGSGLRVLSNISYVDLALTNTSTTSYIQANGNNMQFFVAGGSNSDIVMFLDGTNNRVGIGTLTPSYPLHVQGATYINNELSNGGGVSLYVSGSGDMQLTDGGSIFFGAYTYANGTYIRGYDDGDAMYFYSNGTNTAVMRSTGVGIGTTSPSANLDIKGVQDTAGQISLQLRSGNSAANFSSNQITLGYNNSATYRHAIKTRHNSGAASGNAIDFYTWRQGTDSSATIGTQHVMSLDGANVGIGTTSPLSNLHIKNNVSAGGFANFSDYQLLLWTGSNASASYGLGIEASTLMYHSADNHRFYVANVSRANLNANGFQARYIPQITATTTTTTLTPVISSAGTWHVTALATSLTIAAPTGTANNGERLIIRIKDNGTPQSLTFNGIYRAGGDVLLPAITVANKTLYLGFIYNSTDTKWDLIAKVNNI
jgi:hypothetical protein